MADKVRAVLAGCGGMSRRWVQVSRDLPDLDLVGFVDIREEAARTRAADYDSPDVEIGTDLTAILEKTAPDAVFDCTVPEAHTQVTLEALRHGCHVLGEKPMADSLENAQKAVGAAREAGKTYAVIQNRRYDPNIRRLKRLLKTGRIGPPTTLNSDFYIGAHFGGFRNHMEHVLLLDMAIHTFDAARLIAGADPVSVYCKEWNPAGSWYDHDASAVAIFEMTGGLVYTYRGSWCAEGINTSWECDWRIVGPQGSILWDGNEAFQAQVVEETGAFRSTCREIDIPPSDPADRTGGHAGLIREFVDCIQAGATPETVCTDNIKSLAMVFGAIESATQGKPVDIAW